MRWPRITFWSSTTLFLFIPFLLLDGWYHYLEGQPCLRSLLQYQVHHDDSNIPWKVFYHVHHRRSTTLYSLQNCLIPPGMKLVTSNGIAQTYTSKFTKGRVGILGHGSNTRVATFCFSCGERNVVWIFMTICNQRSKLVIEFSHLITRFTNNWLSAEHHILLCFYFWWWCQNQLSHLCTCNICQHVPVHFWETKVKKYQI